MLNNNYEDIKIKLEAFANKYLDDKIGLLELLDTLHENSHKVNDAQKIELLAASIAYIYLKQHKLNGRGGITTKDVGAFFDVKPVTISGKVMDIEFYLNGGKINIRSHESYAFYDTDRYEVNQMYWDFLDSNEKNVEKNIKTLKKIIKKDSNFFDSYISLYEYYYANNDLENAAKILNSGYDKAIKLVLNNDRFPDELEWGYIENRHIIRMIFHFGMFLWEIEEQKEALGIFMQLLKSNINDNIGARYAIVAMLEGFESMGEYEEKFMSSSGFGLDAMAIEKWFNEASKNHKEVIGWWFDEVEDE
jgi:tetratricopeptide (TPR) repeat protein